MVWVGSASGVEVGVSIGAIGGWTAACWLEVGEEGVGWRRGDPVSSISSVGSCVLLRGRLEVGQV